MRAITFSLITVLLIVVGGCRPDKLKIDAYKAWIDKEGHGLVKRRVINGVTLEGRFLPGEYQAYQDYQANPQQPLDSVLSAYRCGLTFHISLQADKETGNYRNLMYYNTHSQEEITGRTRELSFNASDFTELSYKGKHYVPVLSVFEGYNPIANRISLMLVFSVPGYPCGTDADDSGEFDLTFYDPYWELGTNHFLFQKHDLKNIPDLVIQ